MNKFCIVWVFLMALAVNAQFKVSGEINNYANQDIMVRIFNGPTDILINKVTTDKNGKFSVNIPQKFSGIVRLTDTSKQAVLDLLSDNENVNFKATYQNHSFSNLDVKEGKSAQGFQQYLSFEGFNDMKANIFPVIKSLYGENDEFYKAIQKEEQRIETLSPSSDSPLLQYYIAISSLANTQFDGQMAAEIHKDKIEKRLLNDNNYLEGTGFMSKLVLDYLRCSIFGANSQEQINITIEKELDILLDKADLETPRGQNILSSVFLVLPSEQFSTLLEKYYAKANALTCEITDELKTNLSAHNNTVVGSVVPNILFKNPVKGYKSLYDVKADKKIIVFWASWCPACNDEMPFVKEYYRNFKEDGGEIVSISLDFDAESFKSATIDFD
ncbi:MAG TPA: TlpA disulfide reductase family protein [Moheibacter sp.]|nr:TlpA disulfide reductase family protein [Moheibacter sp.]